MRVVLTEQQAQEIVNYLSARPYAEVVGLIGYIFEGRQEEEKEVGEAEQDGKRKLAEVPPK